MDQAPASHSRLKGGNPGQMCAELCAMQAVHTIVHKGNETIASSKPCELRQCTGDFGKGFAAFFQHLFDLF